MSVAAADVTGPGLAEDIELIVSGIRNGSWVDGALGGVGASLDGAALAIDPIGTLAAWGAAWLIDHVRPLQEALDWLAGDVEQAGVWAEIAVRTDRARQEFASRLDTEVAGWVGASAETYRIHAGEHLTLLQGVSTATGGISFAVEGAGLLVGLVRGIVRDLIAQFIATLAVRLPQWLAMEGLTLGVATPLVASQVAALVARWVNKIQHFIRGLLNSLRRLLPQIDSLTKAFEHLLMLAGRAARRSPTGNTGAAARAQSPSAGGPRKDGDAASESESPALTTPAHPPNPEHKPRGPRTKAHPRKSEDLSLRRENEAADVLAQHGYDVEQNPPGKPNGKNPDYRIGGEYFDCYAPETDNAGNIRRKMLRKVVDDQASRLVVNLEDTPCTMDEIADALQHRPIRDLQQVLIVTDNKVIRFYPFSE